MRTLRLLGVLFLIAPMSVSALSAPFVGSPFAHMTPPLVDDMSLFAQPDSQTAAVAAPSKPSTPAKNQSIQCKGDRKENKTSGTINVKDSMCYNITCDISGGQTDCKYVSICKDSAKGCTASCPKDHGFVTYNSVAGRNGKLDPCNAKQVNNLTCLGDSNSLFLCNSNGTQLNDAQCNADTVDPSRPACAGRTASTVAQTTKNLPDGSLSGSNVAISMCTNNPSECDVCKTDPKSCPIDQTIQAAKDKGAGGVYCEGVNSSAVGAQYNSIIQDACQRNGGTFLGPLDGNGTHATDAGYQKMLGQIGQIENPDSTLENNSGTPTNVSTNDPSRCGFTGVADKIFLPESGCGQNMGSGTYQGPGQFSCDSWAGYAKATGHSDWTDCNNRMDPDKVATVTNAYLGDGSLMQQKYGFTCDSIGATWNSCALAIHACGEGSFNKMVSQVQTNPDAPTSSMCGGNNQPYMNKYNPTGNAGGVFSSLDQFMTCGWSCSTSGTAPGKYLGSGVYAGVPSITMVNQDYSSPGVVVVHDTTSNPAISSGNTGFGGLGGMGGFGLPMGMMLGSGLGGSLFSPSANSNPTYAQATYAPPVPPPSFTFVVQPQTVKRGDPVSVQWKSSGMSATLPCTVTQNGTTIGSGNVGAVSFSTATSTTASSTTPTASAIVFRLVCQAATNGQVYQQASTVVFQ